MSKQKIKKYCNNINILLEKGDVNGVITLINEMEQTIPNTDLYWSRDVFIRCGCDSTRSWEFVKQYPDEFICCISDDYDEHAGIVMKFKNIEEKY